MAPRTNVTDLTDLTIQNCQVFNDPTLKFQVVTQLDPANNWHCHVIKTQNSKRSLFLTATGPDPQRALEILHEKSARSVDHFIIHGGLDHSARHYRGGKVPDSGLSDSDVSESSDDEEEEEPRVRRLVDVLERRPFRVNVPCNSDTDLDLNLEIDLDHCHRRSVTVGQLLPPSHQPQRPIKTSIPPPPPPPTNLSRHPIPLPSIPNWSNPPPISLQQQQQGPPAPVPATRMPIPPPPPSQQTYMPALVNITWPGRGHKNMLVHTPTTIHGLQQIATNEAQRWPMGFQSSFGPIPPSAIPRNCPVRAKVRRVSLGKETYDVVGFGDDLSSLFRCSNAIPKFHIDIVPCGEVKVIPHPRPASASSVGSEPELID